MKEFSEIEKLLLSKHLVIKKNSLELLYPILERLHNPHKNLGKVIHITGTNGKGSVAYMMAAILGFSGYKTALYTSPHIDSMLERIRINGKNISEKDFVRIFNIVYKYAKNLSFFEIITLMAFYYFSEQKVDFSIIEVGIGGRYDTTNIIGAKELCFITSIDYDHTNVLGNTLEEIAYQKAGIIKNGSICISPRFNKKLERIILRCAEENNGRVIFVKDFHKISKIYPERNQMLLKNNISGTEYKVGIIGVKQTLNVSLVSKGIEVLRNKDYKISEKAFKKGLQEPRIKCRFEFVPIKQKGKRKYFIIDGAHNMEAITFFLKTLKILKIKSSIFIFSMLTGKNYIEVLKLLKNIASKIIFTKINSNKAMEPYILADEYQKINRNADITVISDVEQSLIAAFSSNYKYISICGSFYLASEALKVLQNGENALEIKEQEGL